MIYTGDIKSIVLSITNAAGTAPVVTVAPTVMVIQVSSGSTVLAAVAMTLIAGTQAVYTYSWSTAGIPNGDYVAIVSYAADGITVNSRLLETFHIGDTNITGPVALAAIVAQNATVAKDATVAHLSDLTIISPDNSATVQAIKAKTDNLPVDPASMTVLNAIGLNVQDLFNFQFGTWTIDKTQNPQVLTILSPAQAVVARFTLSDSPTATQRAPQ